MKFQITGKIWYWRGPAPFFFVTVPEKESGEINALEKLVTYGWGMIPVTIQIGETACTTALFPKDGLYIVPIKASIRKAEGLSENDDVTVSVEVSLPTSN